MVDATRDAERVKALINRRLGHIASAYRTAPSRLHEAVAYSLLAPGKRVRALLVVLTARHFGADGATAIDPACAVEMVHTASLMLDDLPCMDDATVRRGRPASHIAFGESASVIAAVTLISEASRILATAPGVDAAERCRMVQALNGAIGPHGLAAGQMRDLGPTDADADADIAAAERICREKTAALFAAAAELGGRVARASTADLTMLRRFATHLGIAFQIMDDLIDAGWSAADAGKDVGKDHGKPTVVALLGTRDAARSLAVHCDRAVAALDECSSDSRVLHEFLMRAFPPLAAAGTASAKRLPLAEPAP